MPIAIWCLLHRLIKVCKQGYKNGNDGNYYNIQVA